MTRSAHSRPAARPAGGSSGGPSAGQASLLRRLQRLEGQAAGVARMIEADRPALEVLQQFSALLAATREASVEFALLTVQEELGEAVDDAARIDRVLAEVRLVLERTSRLP